MKNGKNSMYKWLFVILTGMVLIPLPALAEDTTVTTTAPTTMTAPLDGSGNQYRKGQGGEGYTMSADELGLRRRAGGQQGNGSQDGTQTRQRLRDQSGSGSGRQHRYGGNGSYDGSGSYGGGGYGGGGGGGHHGGGGRRR